MFFRIGKKEWEPNDMFSVFFLFFRTINSFQILQPNRPLLFSFCEFYFMYVELEVKVETYIYAAAPSGSGSDRQ